MNYSGLNAVIASIKTSVTCPTCASAYSDNDLAVVSAVDERCVVVAQCPSCHAAILITAALQQQGEAARPQQPMTVHTTPEGQEISLDDVVSIHEALRDFSGDLKSLVDD